MLLLAFACFCLLLSAFACFCQIFCFCVLLCAFACFCNLVLANFFVDWVQTVYQEKDKTKIICPIMTSNRFSLTLVISTLYFRYWDNNEWGYLPIMKQLEPHHLLSKKMLNQWWECANAFMCCTQLTCVTFQTRKTCFDSL